MPLRDQITCLTSRRVWYSKLSIIYEPWFHFTRARSILVNHLIKEPCLDLILRRDIMGELHGFEDSDLVAYFDSGTDSGLDGFDWFSDFSSSLASSLLDP